MSRARRDKSLLDALVVGVLGLSWVGWWFAVPPASAAERLFFSCSAQVYQCFRGKGLELVAEKTGLKIELYVDTSTMAVSRLVNGLADAAASAEPLKHGQKAEGLIEHPFCRDPLVIVVNAENPVTNLTRDQVRAIFSKEVTNWKEVGGAAKPIVVVVPSPESALYRNFSSMIMGGREIVYDVQTRESTLASDVASRYPGSISFVNQGATHGRPEGPRMVKVDGLGASEAQYPYLEVFSLVTKGRPAGALNKFVESLYSQEFQDLLRERGMRPYRESQQ